VFPATRGFENGPGLKPAVGLDDPAGEFERFEPAVATALDFNGINVAIGPDDAGSEASTDTGG